jgi:GT2 family glycosyltransferase
LLNADIKLDSECLKNLLTTDGDVVQPLVLMMASPERINVAGLRPTSLGIAYCMGYKKPRSWAGEVARDIPAASGAALLVRRRVFERIGLFDTAYFMYLEDVDFSLRAKTAGFRVVLSPKAIAWHEYRLKLGLRKILWLFRGSRRIRKLLRSKVS